MPKPDRFSDLAAHRDSGRSVGLLPPEILLAIFYYVYDMTTFNRRSPHEHRIWESVDLCEPGTGMFFPYTISSVCRNWEQVLLLAPEFWSQVIVFVDSPVFSPSQLRAELNASWDREIERIVVTRKSVTSLDSPDKEKQLVRQITEIVSQHAPRCMSIQYDVLFTSSLPPITTAFPHPCRSLASLSLIATVANGPTDAAGASSIREFDQFPALRHLDLDGWNFVELCTRDPGWTQAVMGNYFPHLSITHFKEIGHQTPYHDALSVLAFLPVVFHTLYLGFLQFNIPLNWTPVRRGVIGRPWLADLTLDNIGGELTAWFLKHCGTLRTLTLRNCSLDSIDMSYIPDSYTLTLQDMHTPTEIHSFLCRWTGVILNIENCSGLNDEVLNALGTINRTSEWGLPVFNAPELEELNIRGCDDFSTQALQELTRRRVQPNARRAELGYSVRFSTKVA